MELLEYATMNYWINGNPTAYNRFFLVSAEEEKIFSNDEFEKDNFKVVVLYCDCMYN